jgi:hypothetical protein
MRTSAALHRCYRIPRANLQYPKIDVPLFKERCVAGVSLSASALDAEVRLIFLTLIFHLYFKALLTRLGMDGREP